jgi:hypothetical protein
LSPLLLIVRFPFAGISLGKTLFGLLSHIDHFQFTLPHHDLFIQLPSPLYMATY